MKRLLRRSYHWLSLFGFDPLQTHRASAGMGAYRRGRRELERQAADSVMPFPFGEPRPCLGEAEEAGGQARGHYFHQDLLVARRVFERQPRRHLDVGSRVDGFVAHVAAFRPIEVLDIRTVDSDVPNVTFLQADLMAPLPAGLVGCTDSLSCLHALEHFGLGRYGDPVDHDGHVRGLRNLSLLLEPGGTLYLSVPIGPRRIEYNAHRVFGVKDVLELVSDEYDLVRFSYVDDAGDLHDDVRLAEADMQREYGCSYGCGIFELTKR